MSFGSDEPPWSEEQTDNPLYADDRNFYKVEKWTKGGAKVDRLLYAGNNLEKVRKIFAEALKHRPHQAHDQAADAHARAVAREVSAFVYR